MGYALPGSIGAKLVYPDKKVLSINGDAGFLMNVQDLETAVRNNINVVAVVWLDGEYGLIKWKQQVQFKGEHSDLKFENPNFSDLAKSFQMWGQQIESEDQFIPALNEAFKQKPFKQPIKTLKHHFKQPWKRKPKKVKSIQI